MIPKLSGNDKQNPGVAKFGIALEWGSRGLEFESRHSDQDRRSKDLRSFFERLSSGFPLAAKATGLCYDDKKDERNVS